jgi:hypothetical protein
LEVKTTEWNEFQETVTDWELKRYRNLWSLHELGLITLNFVFLCDILTVPIFVSIHFF